MVFNSYIFILAFLPIVVLVYQILCYKSLRRYAHIFLGLASLLFYGYLHPIYLIFLFLSILVNYVLYNSIVKNANISRKKIILGIGILLNIAALMYFKYYNFFIDCTNLIFNQNFSIKNLILPLGISFITFQQISFLVDAYKNKICRCSVLDYFLFIVYFPHVASGPIITYEQFVPMLHNPERERINWDEFSMGLYEFCMGLGKKVLLADVLARAVNYGYGNISELSGLTAFMVSLSYTAQIYFDFSGYSDMAIGISKMLNLDLPVNFNSPYKAKTIDEFWDRWHMSLTKFLTKYLYIPLGGNRKGTIRTYVNIMIVFLCSGFWHGASYTFIIWGALHGIASCLTKALQKYTSKIPNVINQGITFLFVNVAWILFRGSTIHEAIELIKRMFVGSWKILDEGFVSSISSSVLTLILGKNMWSRIPFLLIISISYFIIFFADNVQENALKNRYGVLRFAWTLLILVGSVLSLSYVSVFVYSNF